MRSTDRWLSVAEATQVIGRSASGVRGLIRDGKLQAVQHVPGGKYQVRESECERYMADLESSHLAVA